MGQRPAIGATEHFFEQLPEFPFTHGPKHNRVGTAPQEEPTNPASIYQMRRIDTKKARHQSSGPTFIGERPNSRLDGIEVIRDHAQHLRCAQTQRFRDGRQQLGAGLLLATLDFGEVARDTPAFSLTSRNVL